MIQIEKIIQAPILEWPWNHKVIDEVFSPKDFEYILEAADHLSFLYDKNKTIPVHIDEAILLGISKKAEDIILDSADLILQNLREIVCNYSNNKATSGTYFIMPKFGITGSYFRYPIHDESLYKILNLVCYLSPEQSVGTSLYLDQEATIGKQLEWMPNRAAVFYPGKGKTWHSWSGQESNKPRITLNFFVEKMIGLRDTLFKKGEQPDALDSLLWFYEKLGQDRLYIEI